MKDKTFRNKKNVKDTLKVFKIVIETLNKYEIKYYLDFGTLLGIVRDNALIPWDNDIDISLYDENDYSKIKDVLKEIKQKYHYRTYLFTFNSSRKVREKKKRPIYVKKVSFTNDENYQIAKIRNNKFWIFGRGNVNIDIFFKYEYLHRSYWFALGQENSVPLEYISSELQEIEFYGIKCKIPKEYDKYLTYKYGNWKVANEEWSHEKDDYSVDTKEK